MSRIEIEDPKGTTRPWAWAYVVPEAGEAAKVQGSLQEILPARDVCQSYTDAIAEGLPATDVWYYDGCQVVAVVDPEWPGVPEDVTGWVDLARKDHPITLILTDA